MTGDWKNAARQNMPRTLSLFGEQIKFDLQEGFPLITTKKMYWKGIVTELLWFLKGDTNIKYLIDNGCNWWNEDAYNYYVKKCKEQSIEYINFETFTHILQTKIQNNKIVLPNNYTLGDCGKQYGWLWRTWEKPEIIEDTSTYDSRLRRFGKAIKKNKIDQLKELIEGLINNPMSRRHILTAWNPATLDDMALNACHAFVQFNCRPLSREQRLDLYLVKGQPSHVYANTTDEDMDNDHVPKYYLDCQLYQRSADSILG